MVNQEQLRRWQTGSWLPFLILPKKGNRKNAPPVCRPSGSLDQPQASGAAQLALAGRTPRAQLRSSNSARLPLRSLAADRGGAQGSEKQKPKPLRAHPTKLVPQENIAFNPANAIADATQGIARLAPALHLWAVHCTFDIQVKLTCKHSTKTIVLLCFRF